MSVYDEQDKKKFYKNPVVLTGIYLAIMILFYFKGVDFSASENIEKSVVVYILMMMLVIVK
ncbi:MAG: hypothetical protein N4A47_02835 [Clostridia bacterium]|jgi:hypothetical protein|nr:hypothetical protein [Clostridia bacterium]